MKTFIINIINKYRSLISNFLFISLGRKKIRGKYIFKDHLGFLFSFSLNSFTTFHLRPKYNKDFKSKNINFDYSQIAILIQGPLIHEVKFTLETINLYIKLFPNINIVVSTWENENFTYIEKISYKKLYIIKSKLPEDRGELNINLQIKSVNEGLKFINSINNIKYVLKTRTDTRIYNPKSIIYLLNLIENFPIKSDQFLKKRILFSSIATCKYRVYGATDITQFGLLEDINNYWSVPFYNLGLKNLVNKDNDPIIKGTPIIAEIYLFSHFLHRNNIKLKWTLDHWWSLLGDYFLIFDSQLIDFYWNKYEKNSEMRFLNTYSEDFPRALNFNDWLKIYFNNYEGFLETNHQEIWEYRNKKFNQLKV